MKVLKISLSGDFAMFKRPDTNKVEMTYSHIPKINVLGILGAEIGLKDLNAYKRHKELLSKKCAVLKEDKYPEFYEKLRGLKIAIVPKEVCFAKEIITKTDTSGHMQKGKAIDGEKNGVNRVTKQQVLISPAWDIYITQGTVSEEIFEKVIDFNLKKWTTYNCFLGKEKYFASFGEPKVLEAELNISATTVNGLIKTNIYDVDPFIIDEGAYERGVGLLPVAYTPIMCKHITEMFSITNKEVIFKEGVEIFSCDGRNLYFF